MQEARMETALRGRSGAVDDPLPRGASVFDVLGTGDFWEKENGNKRTKNPV